MLGYYMSYDTIKVNMIKYGYPNAATHPLPHPSGTTGLLDYEIIMTGTGVPAATFSETDLVVAYTSSASNPANNDAVMLTDQDAGAGQSVKWPPGTSTDTGSVNHTIDFVNGGTGGTIPRTIADPLTFGPCNGTSGGDVRYQYATPSGGGSYKRAQWNTSVSVSYAELAGGFICVANLVNNRVCFASAVTLCFHGDTLIETDKGTVAVRDLKRGDMVRTYQEGFQPISRVLETRTGGHQEFTIIEKDALKLGVPSEKFIITNRHPIKYGDRFVTPGQLATSPLTKHSGIRIETIDCDLHYTLQFDKHYTFNANGVETSSIPTTSNYRKQHLPKYAFHDQMLYDESKIGDESTWLYTSVALRRPLTKEDVNSFKMQDDFSRNVCETLRCCPPLLEKLGRETYTEELCLKCRTLLGVCV